MMGACKRRTSHRFARDPYPFNPMKTTPAPITIDSAWSGEKKDFRTERYPNADLVVAKWHVGDRVAMRAFLTPGRHLDAETLGETDTLGNFERLIEAAEAAARSAGDAFRVIVNVHFPRTSGYPALPERRWYVDLAPTGSVLGDTIAVAEDLFDAARRTEDVGKALKQVRDITASGCS